MKKEKVFKVAKLADGNLVAIVCVENFDFESLLNDLRMGGKYLYTTKIKTEEVRKGLEYFEFLVNGD